MKDQMGRKVYFPEAGDFVRFELPDGRFIELSWREEAVSAYAFPGPIVITPSMSKAVELKAGSEDT